MKLGLRRLRRRYGRAHKREKDLSVGDKHLLRIARDTLKMPDAMIGVMGGGMTRERAKQIIRDLTGKESK